MYGMASTNDIQAIQRSSEIAKAIANSAEAAASSADAAPHPTRTECMYLQVCLQAWNIRATALTHQWWDNEAHPGSMDTGAKSRIAAIAKAGFGLAEVSIGYEASCSIVGIRVRRCKYRYGSRVSSTCEVASTII